MAEILLGKPVADAIKAEVESRVRALRDAGGTPCLSTIRIGDSPDDKAYELSIAKVAESLGIRLDAVHFPKDVAQRQVLSQIERLNNSASIDGCMLFRPLPKHLDECLLCDSLAPSKDVDVIGARALAGVFMGDGGAFAPATAEACVKILDHYGIPLEGKHVVVVGRSLVIGRPVGMLALSRNATVTFCHSRTANLQEVMKSGDVVICAVGKAAAFDAGCFRSGQVVLDVGMNVGHDGKLRGDVDFAHVEPLVKAITPVPRGIGSVTTAVLLEHVACAAALRLKGSRG